MDLYFTNFSTFGFHKHTRIVVQSMHVRDQALTIFHELCP